jgi:hypothetical protein
MSKKTKRRDHYIPQGYLRGFIDPLREKHPRPLWRFDIPRNTWSPRSPKEVGQRQGFYDYAGVGVALETESADSVFLKLENDYPLLRNEMISDGFTRWSEHRDFLLSFMQMMRARSLLFREQKQREGHNLLAWEIEEVSPDRKSVKLKSMTSSPVSPVFIRNRAITAMREEIQKGVAWLKDFDWALRYSDSIAEPFIVLEMPFVAIGPCADVEEAIQHPETLLIFPLCWQACLIGSHRSFFVKTDRFCSEDMERIRQAYRKSAKLFLLSPIKLNNM